jgi:hypothetical protein
MTVSLVEMLGLDLLSKVGNKIAELETENAKLRDQLRWRKWPEEKPEGKDEYMTIIDDEGNDDTCLLFWNGSEFCLRGGFRPLVSYWRPIGELPGDTE